MKEREKSADDADLLPILEQIVERIEVAIDRTDKKGEGEKYHADHGDHFVRYIECSEPPRSVEYVGALDAVIPPAKNGEYQSDQDRHHIIMKTGQLGSAFRRRRAFENIFFWNYARHDRAFSYQKDTPYVDNFVES